MTSTTERRTLSLREYETVPGVKLTAIQRDILASASSLNIRPTIGGHGYNVTAGSQIGTIEMNGLSVHIEPKVPIDRVMFLISYATGVAALAEAVSQFTLADDVLEAIVAGFAAQVERAVRPGLLQGYRIEEDALSTVRGRIRFDDQIRKRLGVVPPVEVRYDEFTEDIDENRIVKAALNRLARMRLRSSSSVRVLRSLRARMSLVGDVEYGPQLPYVTFTRLNERYRPAVRLAELILRSTTYDVASGEVSSSSFLVDMNTVFEDFVVVALRDSLRVDQRVFPQGGRGRRLKLDVDGRVPLKPDISWWRGRDCLFIGDVKYKRADGGVPNSDIYQVLAYAIATGLRTGLLIYAAGEREPGRYRIAGVAKNIDVVTLDLTTSPDGLLSQIDMIASRIRASRRSPKAIASA